MTKAIATMLPAKSVSFSCAILTSVFLAASDSQADTVYVSNTGAGTITRIDSSGNSSLFASGLSSPKGLAFDGAGNLYVADSGDGTISVIDPAGNVSTFASGLNGPSALTFDSGGNLYVASPGNQAILRVDASRTVSVFMAGMVFNHDGAHLTADNAGNIYANTYNTVVRFDSSGNGPADVGGGGATQGIALDGAGHLYYALQNPCVISGNGGLLTGIADFPSPYNNNLQLAAFQDTPCDLAFDNGGNLFATFGNVSFDNPSHNGSAGNVLMEFGVNGENSVVATDIGGTYIAVQPVPEPGIWTFAGGVAAVLCVRKRAGRRHGVFR